MSVFQSLEDARAYFEGDRFAMENGITLEEIGEGMSLCAMELSRRHQNAEGGVMGGAIFTLIDLSFAAAAKARSMRVNMAPPITPPSALRCRFPRVRLHTARPSPISSSVTPFSRANRSPSK